MRVALHLLHVDLGEVSVGGDPAVRVLDQHQVAEARHLIACVDHIAVGRTNHQIGAEMHLADKTVKNYVSSLLHKLGFTRRTEAAVFATELRLPGH